jgi:hypothetical protein
MLYNNFISNIAKLGKPYTPERAKRESIEEEEEEEEEEEKRTFKGKAHILIPLRSVAMEKR